MTYLEYFQLNEKPFKLSPDPRFMWFSEAHKEAWASLHFGVLDKRGFILLIGDVGTGKTTVINKLVQGLDKNTHVARIYDPGLDQLDFFRFLAAQFNIKSDFRTKGEFLVEMNLFLHRAHEERNNVVVIVDEAQRLSDEMLEEIRLLSNIERPDEKLINIVLVGQNELNQKLLKDANRALRQRITTLYTIGPLARNEVEDFIRFRLKVAGTEEKIFTDRAVRLMANYSRGNPRLINVMGDQALLTAFVQEKHRVDEIVVQQCIKELKSAFSGVNKAKDEPASDPGADAAAPAILPKKQDEKDPDGRNGIGDARLLPPRPRPWPRILATGLAVVFLGLLAFQAISIYPPRYLERWTAPAGTSSRNVYQIHSSVSEDGPPLQSLPDGGPSEVPATAPGEGSPPGMASLADRETQTFGAGEAEAVQLPAPEQSPATGGVGEGNPVPGDVQARQLAHPVAVGPLAPEAASPGAVPLSKETTVIRFPYNSNQIGDDAFQKLQQLAEVVKSRPGTRLIITGYTDSLGDKTYNINVSKFRADAIKSYFIGQGISAAQITATGLGPANPVASDDTYHGRSQNRRVEIEMIAGD
jgi:general secretion pathway protein A